MGLFSIFRKSSVLYYPGCYTYFKYKANYELYKKIFDRLGIEFREIDKKVCCGLPAIESGYDAEARKLARRNFEIFKEEQITSIITNSPCCYKMFLYDYPEILPDWNIEPKNIWRIILVKLESKPSLIGNKASGDIVYNDSCYLGRYCGIYNEPRDILEMIGYEVKELYNTKEECMCSGSCGGLIRANPELANEIAKEKLLQVKRTGAKRIVVVSMEEYDLLKKNSEGSEVEVLELAEVLGDALGLRKEVQTNKAEEAEREEKKEEGEEKEEEKQKEKGKKEIEKIIEIKEEGEAVETEVEKETQRKREIKDIDKIISDSLAKPKDEIVRKIREDLEKR